MRRPRSSGAIHAPSDVEDQPPESWTSEVCGSATATSEVLHGIDLNIPGQITALFGANGSGKSTLCSTISGLVPACSGSITLDGEDITPCTRYRRVGRACSSLPSPGASSPA